MPKVVWNDSKTLVQQAQSTDFYGARAALIATAAAAITATSTAVTSASATVPAAGGARGSGTVGRGIAAGEPVRETPAADAAAGIIAVVAAGAFAAAPCSAVLHPRHQPIANRRYAGDRDQEARHPAHPNILFKGGGRFVPQQRPVACRIRRQTGRIRSLIIAAKYGTFAGDRPLFRCPLF